MSRVHICDMCSTSPVDTRLEWKVRRTTWVPLIAWPMCERLELCSDCWLILTDAAEKAAQRRAEVSDAE